MSNYPPGMTITSYPAGAYKVTCPQHGTSYGNFYNELGGLFMDETMPRGVDEWANPEIVCPDECQLFEDLVWEEVDAARCTEIVFAGINPHDGVIEHVVACGLWTEIKMSEDIVGEHPEYEYVVTLWGCPEDHEFETEEI